jgi:Ran GTPase-activating protein (RanGAP) involved in mRNA processing and transport
MKPEINCPIIRVPEVFPCELSELEPLILHLESNTPVEETQIFPRGALLPDGRLDLCKQSVGPEGCALLTKALRNNLQVKSLLLGTDAIGDQGAKDVADLIENNSSLEIIYLGCNHISSAGAEEITSVMEANTNIQGLWFKRNPIGDEGLIAIAQMLRENTNLKSLDVVNCGFGLEGLTALCDSLCKSNRTLKRLYLSGNGIGVEGAQLLSRVLRENSTLESLFVSVNNFGDEGTEIIAEALKQNNSLKEISLGSSGIGTNGAQALCEAISNHPTLEILDINRAASQNVLGALPNDFSHAADFFVEMLKQNTSLRRFQASGTKIPIEGARKLDKAAQAHPKLTHFHIDVKLSTELKTHLNENLERLPDTPTASDVTLIRSVYRTAKA